MLPTGLVRGTARVVRRTAPVPVLRSSPPSRWFSAGQDVPRVVTKPGGAVQKPRAVKAGAAVMTVFPSGLPPRSNAARNGALLVALAIGGIAAFAAASGESFTEVLARVRRHVYRFYAEAGGGIADHDFASVAELEEAEADMEAALRDLLPPRDALEAAAAEVLGTEHSQPAPPGGTGPSVSSPNTHAGAASPVDPFSLPELTLHPTVVLALDGVCLDVSYHPQVRRCCRGVDCVMAPH
jgi:hypothetical protein